ncbi:type II secretion system protein GspD [Vibrio owensii]|uniref:type II secretion system protein GspD n=1 Tax=Vibrio harveyi group TaxID=717610 RepID=UPI003CC5551D
MIKTTCSLRSALSIAIGCLVLSGCSSSDKAIPDSVEDNWNEDSVKAKMIDDWRTAEPPIQYVPTNADLVLEKEDRLPEHLYNQHLSTDFNGSGTMMDLIPLLKQYGLYLVIPEEELINQSIVIIQFEGKLGDYLSAMEAAYGISFNYHQGNILTVDKLTSFQLRIPQDKVIADQIQKDLEAMGGTEIKYSVNSGTVFYKATQKQHKIITKYLERLSINTSLVSMQVAVITLRQEKNKAEGINWSELNMSLGFGPDDTLGVKGSDNGSSDDNEDSDNASSAADAIVGAVTGSVNDYRGHLGGHNSSLYVSRGDFTMSAVVDYLSTYGDTETSQSLLLKTLSGREVKINSGEKVPYISEISNDDDDDDDSSGNSSNVTIEFLDLGTKLNLTPWFDSDSQFITVNVDLEISGLTGWIDLNGGNIVGVVSQPQTHQQKFTDVIKVPAGDSVIIGGISSKQSSDNRNAPIFLDKTDATYQKVKETKTSTFILIRPTVTVFGINGK